MRLLFTHSVFCLDEAGAGQTYIPGKGVLAYDRASDTDDSTLLGSVFNPQDTSIGYSQALRRIANAEHEATHLWVCERLLHKASPNHSILIEDIHSKLCLLWRTREEILVVGIQWYVNTGEITECFRFVCKDEFGIDCESLLPEAEEFFLIRRSAFEATVNRESTKKKCDLERLC